MEDDFSPLEPAQTEVPGKRLQRALAEIREKPAATQRLDSKLSLKHDHIVQCQVMPKTIWLRLGPRHRSLHAPTMTRCEVER
jgi:hypothetical protein